MWSNQIMGSIQALFGVPKYIKGAESYGRWTQPTSSSNAFTKMWKDQFRYDLNYVWQPSKYSSTIPIDPAQRLLAEKNDQNLILTTPPRGKASTPYHAFVDQETPNSRRALVVRRVDGDYVIILNYQKSRP